MATMRLSLHVYIPRHIEVYLIKCCPRLEKLRLYTTNHRVRYDRTRPVIVEYA